MSQSKDFPDKPSNFGLFRTAYNDDGDFCIMLGEQHFSASPYDCFDKPKHLHRDIQALCDTINSLHAYAKAEELRNAMIAAGSIASGNWEQCAEAFHSHLVSMGWDKHKQHAGLFLVNYRDAALKQLETK